MKDGPTTFRIPDPAALVALGTGFGGWQAFLSAVELGVFPALADGPLPLAVLAEKVGLHPRGARDFLDALVTLGLLARDGDAYRNTAEADAYLVPGRPTFIGALFHAPGGGPYRGPYGYWDRLTEALRTGRPQTPPGADADRFATYYADPASLERFLAVMSATALPAAGAIAERFAWEGYRTFADIGCAQGTLGVEVARVHDHIAGIGFDLPAVAPLHERNVARHGLSARIAFQAGDFHRDPLPTADVLVMGHLLHDWDLDTRLMLIGKAFEALRPGGALLIYDAMLDDMRQENLFGLLSSLNLLIKSPGGSEYTTGECIAWLGSAGFREITVTRLPGADSMVVGLK